MTFFEGLDQGVLPWMQNHHDPWLDWLMVHITDLGDQPALYLIVLAAVALLAWRRQLRTAVVVATVALAGAAFSDLVKRLVERPRPYVLHPLIPVPGSWSFPSG